MGRFLFLVFLTCSAFAQRPGDLEVGGYGELRVVEPNRTAVYDITRTTCALSQQGPVDYPAVDYPSADRMVVSGNYYRYTLHRIDALPERCTVTADVFDAFWENAERALLRLRGARDRLERGPRRVAPARRAGPRPAWLDDDVALARRCPSLPRVR
jgi:hypothetical protein